MIRMMTNTFLTRKFNRIALLGVVILATVSPSMANTGFSGTFQGDGDAGFSTPMINPPMAGILHAIPVRAEDLLLRPTNPVGSFHARMLQQVQLHSALKQMFNGTAPVSPEPLGMPRRHPRPY
jgi:hypothetical protein